MKADDKDESGRQWEVRERRNVGDSDSREAKTEKQTLVTADVYTNGAFSCPGSPTHKWLKAKSQKYLLIPVTLPPRGVCHGAERSSPIRDPPSYQSTHTTPHLILTYLLPYVIPPLGPFAALMQSQSWQIFKNGANSLLKLSHCTFCQVGKAV